jgi:hypothetical protein
VTHIRRASLNGTAVPRANISAAFPWLLERRGRVAVVRQYSADLVFADEDESIYQVFVNQLGTSAAVTVTITLLDGAGRSVYRQAWPLEPGEPRRLHVELPAPVAARRMRLDATTHTGEPVRLLLDDLRLQGQTRALAEYVRSSLRFPAP